MHRMTQSPQRERGPLCLGGGQRFSGAPPPPPGTATMFEHCSKEADPFSMRSLGPKHIPSVRPRAALPASLLAQMREVGGE